MYQRKTRRFRRRPNGRPHSQHSNGGVHRIRPNIFSNDQKRNNFRTPQSAEKLFEKYTALAKEAISTGDKTLSENYLQHADHFMRIIEDRNRIRNQNKTVIAEKPLVEEKSIPENNNTNQDQPIKNEE